MGRLHRPEGPEDDKTAWQVNERKFQGLRRASGSRISSRSRHGRKGKLSAWRSDVGTSCSSGWLAPATARSRRNSPRTGPTRLPPRTGSASSGALKQVPHVSTRTAWDDVTAELEELRRETERPRADLLARENARVDQGFAKARSLFAKGRVPAGRRALAPRGRRCRIGAGSVPGRVPPRAGVEVCSARFVRGGAVGREAGPRARGVGQSAGAASRRPRPTDTFGRPRVRRWRRPRSARPCGRFSSCRPA